jgi:hypothetical protein
MIARSCRQFETDRRRDHCASRAAVKLRPASQSYLTLLHRESWVLTTIATVCGVLIYVGVWLIRLLG